MKLQGRELAVVLTDDGRQALAMLGWEQNDEKTLLLYVEETEEMGLWVRSPKSRGEHIVFIWWEFILTMDLLQKEAKSIGYQLESEPCGKS